MLRTIVLLFIAFILLSLGSALYYLVKDRGTSNRVAKALTVRIVLSVVLFTLLMLGIRFGIITQRL